MTEKTGKTGKISVKALVADDAGDLQELIACWLEDAGHQVRRASNGREIMQLIREEVFDLLVTDILMPDGDGWDAIAEVHRLWPDTRIIAMSGGSREMPPNAVLRAARAAGAIAVLQKPFNRAAFMEAVAAVFLPVRDRKQ